MVAAAATLIRERKDNYGTNQPWYNLDPNHALPANVRLGGLAQSDRNPNGVWKCNLFGGNALYVAGFEPPYYGNRGKGEYPNANQFYTFSDKYAAQFGNKVHFKMVDEVALNGLDEATKKARLIEVLRNAQPGDLLMVDHQGTDISDGGHTRVVMANDLQADGTISGRIAKDLFVAMEETGKDPAVLVEERGLKQVTDTGPIEAAIKAVIEANPDNVAAYRAKPSMFGWFVGQVMKATGGKANPKVVNELLRKALDA